MDKTREEKLAAAEQKHIKSELKELKFLIKELFHGRPDDCCPDCGDKTNRTITADLSELGGVLKIVCSKCGHKFLDDGFSNKFSALSIRNKLVSLFTQVIRRQADEKRI